MTRKGDQPLDFQIASNARIWLFSAVAGSAAFTITLLIQWLVYDDWMHWKGPLRVVGSTLAGALASVLAAHWQSVWRRRKLELLRRFETIAQMNDRIRNALQAIQCVDYAANFRSTESVQSAVCTIDRVLKEVLSGVRPSVADGTGVQIGRAEEVAVTGLTIRLHSQNHVVPQSPVIADGKSYE